MPANIDPDAESTDVIAAPGKHVAAAADALVDQLCGEIEIIHVKRGSGTRQAFHDRYLGLVNRDGTPTVYLLSNGLSKAAGDWPFTVAEIDTPTSWRIAAYVASVASGDDGGAKQVESTTVWRSSDAKGRIAPTSGALINVFASELWASYFKLFELKQQGRLEERSLTDPIVDRLAAVFPNDGDEKSLANALVEGMNERDHLVPPMAQRLSELAGWEPVAAQMEDIILQRLLSRLSSDPRQLSALSEQHSLLRQAGEILSRRPRGTNLVRNRINPVAEAYACSLEVGRTTQGQLKRLISGIHLVLIGLYLVQAGNQVSLKFRIGIATDYVNLLGRLLRSVESRRCFDASTLLSGVMRTNGH